MSNITALDENEISEHVGSFSSSGVGHQLTESMGVYSRRLNNISNHSFGKKDTSTAHEVIDELARQMNSVSEVVAEANLMMDNLFYIMQTSILDEEDKQAACFLGD